MSAISHDLFRRISDRAGDPRRRTYMAAAEADAEFLDFAQLKGDMRAHSAPGAMGLLNLADALEGMLGKLGGAVAIGPEGPIRLGGKAPSPDLSTPPDAATIELAERQIGRRFPEELRQLYAISDGGFGPGQGLFAIGELARRYLELTTEPFGPLGQEWPANLLPICEDSPALVCLDFETGVVIVWDPEEIEDEESDDDWQRSFRPEQESLAALMDEWLMAPTFQDMSAKVAQATAERSLAAQTSPVTGWPIQLETPNSRSQRKSNSSGIPIRCAKISACPKRGGKMKSAGATGSIDRYNFPNFAS